jgi:hypothetical protein
LDQDLNLKLIGLNETPHHIISRNYVCFLIAHPKTLV